MTASERAAATFRRVLHAPLLHFLLLGGALFVATQLARPTEPALVVRLTAGDVQRLEAEFELQAGRPPAPSERQALIRAEVDERLLLASAHALDWHANDTVAVQRLIRNQRFLAPDDPASDAELLARAREQGMDRSDIVVRRRLIERMRLTLGATAHERPPSREALDAWRLDHAATFTRPELVRISQILLARDRRGAALADDAAALGRRIAANEIRPEQAAKHSDPTLLRSTLPLTSEAAIAREFGHELAVAAMRTPVGTWSGPVESAYGMHFVYVHEHEPARLPELDEIEAEVRDAWTHEQGERTIREHVATLRERAEVIVESPDA